MQSAQSDFGCDLIEVKLHSFGITGWQHEGGAGSPFGADRTEQIGRLGALIVNGARALRSLNLGLLGRRLRGVEPFLAQR